MPNISNGIVNDIEAGMLTFSQIAEKYNVTYSDVMDVYEEMMYQNLYDGADAFETCNYYDGE